MPRKTKICQNCFIENVPENRNVYCSEKCRLVKYIEKTKESYIRRSFYWEGKRPHQREKRNEIMRNTRLLALKKLGERCVSCGYNKDFRALQIDHVFSDGYKDRASNRWRVYSNIVKGIDLHRFQVLCANCNFIKRYENKEFAVHPLKGKSKYKIEDTGTEVV